ncbi:hypothetical protein [Sporisorium scitamineum]|uniref:Uncharacterized protein n=1 Tax=Sporisorium scitamineum TaxID=49012 RepID=A0A0F7S2J2_9BASI|nr:hypothetical protein [Sporisorium scitamineum]
MPSGDTRAAQSNHFDHRSARSPTLNLLGSTTSGVNFISATVPTTSPS